VGEEKQEECGDLIVPYVGCKKGVGFAGWKRCRNPRSFTFRARQEPTDVVLGNQGHDAGKRPEFAEKWCKKG